MTTREEIVREVARAMCASEDQDSAWHCTDACVREQECARLGKPIKCLYRDLAEAAVSLCFARAADYHARCVAEWRDTAHFAYANNHDDTWVAAESMAREHDEAETYFRALTHHVGQPAQTTIASATQTPTASPASDAARGEGGA